MFPDFKLLKVFLESIYIRLGPWQNYSYEMSHDQVQPIDADSPAQPYNYTCAKLVYGTTLCLPG